MINKVLLQLELIKIPTPFVKWAGGKRQLLPEILTRLPKNSFTKYSEPFVGGGAVFYAISTFNNPETTYINDTNEILVNAYKIIKEEPDLIIDYLEKLKQEYLPLSDDDRKLFFYAIRELYNSDVATPMEKTVYFIFLNKTCFNGLYRVNSKGKFNVPHGKYKNPSFYNPANILNLSETLKNTVILNSDFESLEQYIDDETFVYFDPPYRPLNITSSFTAYSKSDFNDSEQIRLANFFKNLDKKGAKLMLSNSDPKNTNPDDSFFDELYKGFNIQRIQARRTINSNASKRGSISELLITNY